MRPWLLALALLPAGLGAAACGLDAGFGSGGYSSFSSPSGGSTASGYDLLVLSDGRLLVAGAGTRAAGDLDAAWWCTDSGGSLQGSGAYHSLAGGSDEEFYAAAQAPSGGPVYLAGYALDAGGTTVIAVRRLTFPGLVDDSGFANAGLLTLTAAGPAYGVAVDSSGRIYLAGEAQLWRLNSSGSPDAGFGSGGSLTFDASGSAHDLRLDSAGRLVLSGGLPNGVALWRRLATGAADSSFGTGGRVSATVGSGLDFGYLEALQILPGDALLASGYLYRPASGSSAWLALRSDANGAGVSGFGTAGLAQGTESATFFGVHRAFGSLDAGGGQWLLTGNSVSAFLEVPTLWRLLANGSLDSSFGSGGESQVSSSVGQIRRPRPAGAYSYATGNLGNAMALWRFSACNPSPTPTPSATPSPTPSATPGGPSATATPAALPDGAGGGKVLVYPQPAHGHLSLAWQQTQSANVQLQVFDERGLRLRAESKDLDAGAQRWDLDLAGLAPGVYLFSLRASVGASPDPGKFVVLP